MKIADKHPFIRLDAYVKNVREAVKSGEGGQPASAGDGHDDTVKVSVKARRIQEARAILDAVPDVREDRVADIKARIENGTYSVDPKDVAAKIVEESLLNELL
ncbi:MAG TPA: flagellar biosynthesis anti-sigma factor FlgM [Thermodesulfobacteriota bacterium]|nr:flagellar biosynthesis anti-sigma factor FlgM [Deltaproteobacteria bacterium]HNR14006.1 flagellar biosynthesis anti-sigma factor FlgM [Thermodesulfobacteriota bacterium]HNU70256.1 flagellar biosynthesis anti-sigma factor FlgM [Thermodesulfobacteriota bacterium]HOC37901.1 flagellar biosynthesis anti-sigma factor FlgM [Thermodesulfobacteriota bacterium]